MRIPFRSSLAVLVGLVSACGGDPPPVPVTGQEPARFTRWTKTGDTEGRLETAIATYRDPQGREVDLIGAVHIADTGYYRGLQARFAGYDALLYEMVAPKGARPSRESNSLISRLQRGLKDFLDLDFQLDAIDYSRPNFVHADLDPTQFFAKQQEKGESLFSIMLRAMLVGLQREREGKGSKVTPLHLLLGLVSGERSLYMKFLFAQELENVEQMLAAFGGDKGEASVIVGERNREAFRVLDEELAKGRHKLGIFYGAAHLPDMETRLWKRGFRRVAHEWLTAWDVTRPAPAAEDSGKTPEAGK